MNFSEKTVMVTGAAGSLGQAVAHAFAQQGARLVLIDLRARNIPVAFRPGVESLHANADLRNEAEVVCAVNEGFERFGRIDVVCNLAGGFRMGEAVHETTRSTYDFLFDLNIHTVVNVARSVVPVMLKQGSGKIINVSAFAAQRGAALMGAYAAAKAAVARLTEAMSAELREHGINVNCVLPTILDTPENREAMPLADPTKWVALEDLANAIVFLGSDGAKAIHGASLPVSGLS